MSRRRVWRWRADRGEDLTRRFAPPSPSADGEGQSAAQAQLQAGPGPAGTESFDADASIPPVAPALPAPARMVGDVSDQQLIRYRPWDKAAPFCRHGMEHGIPCHVHVKGSGFAWASVNDGDLVLIDGAGAPQVLSEIRFSNSEAFSRAHMQ